MEPHPEHLCGAYPYVYPPMTAAMVPQHAYKDWTQIRYPPPPMPMEHPPPLPSSRLFVMVSLCLPSCRFYLERKAKRGGGNLLSRRFLRDTGWLWAGARAWPWATLPGVKTLRPLAAQCQREKAR